MANFIDVVDRAAELTATLVKEYVDQRMSGFESQIDGLSDEVREAVEGLSDEVREAVESFEVDNTVTAEGSNAVTGAAVAAYVAQQLTVITDYEGVAF